MRFHIFVMSQNAKSLVVKFLAQSPILSIFNFKNDKIMQHSTVHTPNSGTSCYVEKTMLRGIVCGFRNQGV